MLDCIGEPSTNRCRGSPGVTAGATFELFYEPDYLLPHRHAAWLLISERLAEAAALAAHLSDVVPVLAAVADGLSRLSDKIGETATRSVGEAASPRR